MFPLGIVFYLRWSSRSSQHRGVVEFAKLCDNFILYISVIDPSIRAPNKNTRFFLVKIAKPYRTFFFHSFGRVAIGW